MTFLQRMKKDKKFRFKVVVIILIILMAIGQVPGEKKEAPVDQATCNLANTVESGFLVDCRWSQSEIDLIGGDICMDMGLGIPPRPTDQAIEICVANLCKVGMKSLSGINRYACLSLVPNGMRTNNPDNCKEDSVVVDADDDYGILCKAYASGVDPSTRSCNAAMEGIAKIVQNFMPNMGCTSAFYIAIFGGGMIALMIFAAM